MLVGKERETCVFVCVREGGGFRGWGWVGLGGRATWITRLESGNEKI